MRTRNAWMLAWAGMIALVACSDGGPPTPFRLGGTRAGQPALAAADGGQSDLDDAGESDASR